MLTCRKFDELQSIWLVPQRHARDGAMGGMMMINTPYREPMGFAREGGGMYNPGGLWAAPVCIPQRYSGAVATG